VFLDRDGVINRVLVRNGKPYPPHTLAEFEIFPGVPEAIRAFKDAGFLVIVATNQPDIATGVQRLEVLEEMHDQLRRELNVDDIYVCCHTDNDNCECRKPKPGMLHDAAAKWSIDLRQSVMVGDRWRDIGAGQAAGCRTILVRNNYDERQADNPDAVVESLWEARGFIV